MADRPPIDPRDSADARANESSISVCPDCGGVLGERLESGVAVWECRVGHRYSREGLVDAQAINIESALWVAIRALEDRARLLERMAQDSENRGMGRSARSFTRRARGAAEQAQAVREALTRATELSLFKPEHDETDTFAAGASE